MPVPSQDEKRGGGWGVTISLKTLGSAGPANSTHDYGELMVLKVEESLLWNDRWSRWVFMGKRDLPAGDSSLGEETSKTNPWSSRMGVEALDLLFGTRKNFNYKKNQSIHLGIRTVTIENESIEWIPPSWWNLVREM